jgi:hypothetical protein
MSGYYVIDILVKHFEQLREKPVTHKANRATLEGGTAHAITGAGNRCSKSTPAEWLCTINPRTSEEDIRETFKRLESFGQ